MRETWILEVLADIQRFARSNQMLRLAEALDDVSAVAMEELSPPIDSEKRAGS